MAGLVEVKGCAWITGGRGADGLGRVCLLLGESKMTHLRSSGFTRRVVLLSSILGKLAWRRRSSPTVLMLWGVLMWSSRNRHWPIVARILRLRCRLSMMRVRGLSRGSNVVELGFASVEVLGWAIDVGWSVVVECWIWTRRLTRRRHVIPPKAVLIESLGEPFLQHPVVISYSCLQLGMQIKQGIYVTSVRHYNISAGE